MKKTAYLIIAVLVVVLAVSFVVDQAVGAGGMSQTSGNVKVLLDNDEIRIAEAVRHPGTVVPMHTHPKYMGYFFGPWKGRFTSKDGKITEKEFAAGDVVWSPNGKTHALEVIGDTDQHVLIVEMKKCK